MLVLTRKVGETVLIDGGIKIVVNQIRGGRIQLAIEAPPETMILRGELVQKLPGLDTKSSGDTLDQVKGRGEPSPLNF